MKDIDNNTFELILDLCNLELSSKDKTSRFKDINTLLNWVDELNKINTTNTKPLVHLFTDTLVIEDNIPETPLSHKDIIQNAPSKNYNYIVIPNKKQKQPQTNIKKNKY